MHLHHRYGPRQSHLEASYVNTERDKTLSPSQFIDADHSRAPLAREGRHHPPRSSRATPSGTKHKTTTKPKRKTSDELTVVCSYIHKEKIPEDLRGSMMIDDDSNVIEDSLIFCVAQFGGKCVRDGGKNMR